MGNKKLLVVMPIYNESESIKKTFSEWNSEFKQDKFFSKIDLLLIDDGSTDDTGIIIEKIRLENENVIIYKTIMN